MALKISLPIASSSIGIPMPDSYAKIMKFNNISCASEQDMLQFLCGFYYDVNARLSGSEPVFVELFTVNDFDYADQQSIKKKLYDHLKTLPKFSGSIDV